MLYASLHRLLQAHATARHLRGTVWVGKAAVTAMGWRRRDVLSEHFLVCYDHFQSVMLTMGNYNFRCSQCEKEICVGPH